MNSKIINCLFHFTPFVQNMILIAFAFIFVSGITALAEKVGIIPANLPVLKTGKAKAVRFSALEALCRELKCQPGDLLEFIPDEAEPFLLRS